jgi:CO/xanthine dehydrogenase Mo-binding subunit
MTENNEREYYREGLPIPETPAPGVDPAPWKKTAVVGKPLPRVDAYERVSGTAVYPSDLILPGMLYAAVVRSPHPNARVKWVDTARARKMPGVRAVIDASTPGADLEWRYRGSVASRLFDPACRFEGDAVAAVAAETPYQARDAARAVVVDYEVLPFVSDEGKALNPGAPAVHEGGNAVSDEQVSERGDVESGFAQAEVVLEETYRTACEIHTPVELHGCVARWDGDALTIWESTQGVYRIQSQAAEALKLPLAKVRVIGHYMGGGFGSKLQAGKYTMIAALLARMTARPVKLFLSREETFLAAGNRPPTIMTLKAGVKRDGTLTALEYRATGASGAYPAGGAGAALDWLVRDLYTCPNVRTRTQDVYLNAGPARPFRAPGHPPCAWALEQMMDALAEAIDMDPVELRLKNVPSVSQGRGGPPYTTTGFAECLRKGAEAFGWAEARKRAAGASKGHLKRGVGMAGGLWAAGGGGPPSTVILKLFSDGSMNLNLGASDIGTGTKTVMAMVVSEELGIKPELIQIEHADTGTTQFATPSGGSKTVPTESPAVRAAAVEVKRELFKMAGEELEVDPADLTLDGSRIVSRTDRAKGVDITGLRGLERRGVVVGIGYRGPNPAGKAVNPFAAQFCEVEVNTRTGETRILRFLGAHDSGRVMNRLTYANQVFGGITMGIGLAMTEARILDKDGTGKMVNRNWHDYKLPTMLDTPPENVCLPVELDDAEANTTGAKGLGEPATIPTAPAVANAIRHATGVRVTDTPADPVRMMELLAGKGRTER